MWRAPACNGDWTAYSVRNKAYRMCFHCEFVARTQEERTVTANELKDAAGNKAGVCGACWTHYCTAGGARACRCAACWQAQREFCNVASEGLHRDRAVAAILDQPPAVWHRDAASAAAEAMTQSAPAASEWAPPGLAHGPPPVPQGGFRKPITTARALKEASVLRAVDEATAAIKENQFKTEPEEPESSRVATARVVERLVEHAQSQDETIDEMKVMIEQLLDEQQQLKHMLQDLSADQATNTTHILQKLKTIVATSSSSSGPSTSRPNTLNDELPVAAAEEDSWRIAEE